MCHHIYNWNIIACDIKQPISLPLEVNNQANNVQNSKDKVLWKIILLQ